MYVCVCVLRTHATGPSTAIFPEASHPVYSTHVQFIDMIPEIGLILDIEIGTGPNTGQAMVSGHVINNKNLSLTQRSDLVVGG